MSATAAAGRLRLCVPQQQQLSHAAGRYQVMPVCRRAASDIIDWLQGGSNVSLTSTRPTVGMTFELFAHVLHQHIPHAAARRRQRHGDADIAASTPRRA